MNVFPAFRMLDPDREAGRKLAEQIRIYPYDSTRQSAPNHHRRDDGGVWSQMPPRGLHYWERLAETINQEPVHERDRLMMAMLKPSASKRASPSRRPTGRRRSWWRPRSSARRWRGRTPTPSGSRSGFPRPALVQRHRDERDPGSGHLHRAGRAGGLVLRGDDQHQGHEEPAARSRPSLSRELQGQRRQLARRGKVGIGCASQPILPPRSSGR